MQTLSAKIESVKQPQVDEQIFMMENIIARLHDRIDELSARTRPILSDLNEKSCHGIGEPAQPLAPLAERIRALNYTAEDAIKKVQNIINCLEI